MATKSKQSKPGSKKLRVTLKKSVIGTNETHRLSSGFPQTVRGAET